MLHADVRVGRVGEKGTEWDAWVFGVPDGKQQTPRAAPEEARAAGAGHAGRRGWLIVQGGWEPRVRAGGESKRPRAGNASPMCSAICAPGLRFGSQL